eukprot:33079_1
MPKDILHIVFAPKKFSQITDIDDLITWDQARKRMHQFHSKPFLIGNPKFIRPPIEYPFKKADEKHSILRNLIALWWGDITKLKIECVVNSANIKLKNGGGVCGAIHRRAGDELVKECITKYPNGVHVTDCVVTKGYNLPSTLVIHAVGPSQMDKYKLSQTYKNTLKLCIENNIKQVCFTCIGCGTHDLPLKEASQVAVYSVVHYLMQPYIVDKKSNHEMKQNDENKINDKQSKDDHEENKDEKKQENDVVADKDVKASKGISNADVKKTENDTIVSDKDVKDNKSVSNVDVKKTENKQKDIKFAYEFFDKIVFNCWTEEELDMWKYRLTEQLG